MENAFRSMLRDATVLLFVDFSCEVSYAEASHRMLELGRRYPTLNIDARVAAVTIARDRLLTYNDVEHNNRVIILN